MKKNLWLIFGMCVLISSLLVINNVWALLSSRKVLNMQNTIAKWNIKISDVLATDSQTTEIDVDSFYYTENDTVDDGYIAPGRNGYFYLVLDPTDTEVAIDYDISFDLSSDYQSNIYFSVSSEDDEEISGDGTNFSGLITLDDIEEGNVLTLKVTIVWEDQSRFNVQDTELGKKRNNKISIPVSITLSQHLGE